MGGTGSMEIREEKYIHNFGRKNLKERVLLEDTVIDASIILQ
jgi:hypothetical protein